MPRSVDLVLPGVEVLTLFFPSECSSEYFLAFLGDGVSALSDIDKVSHTLGSYVIR